jgi:microcystin degradation protein MlrC
METNFGLTAVLAIGSLRIAVRSVGGLEWDTGQFTSVGLDLNQATLVFVKSPSHFRATFEPHASLILTADTPGPTRVNIREVNYKNLTRPIHPLDEI